jgi:hypothetical protein
MAGRRRYTKREKATAVIAAEMSNELQASEATGVPRSTLRYWMDDPQFASLRQKTREDAVAGFGVLMHAAQGRLMTLIPTMEARDLTVLLGVATDKAQLLAGHATDRTETRDLGNPFDDHETRALVESARKYLGGDGPAEGAGVGPDETVAGDRPGEPASS